MSEHRLRTVVIVVAALWSFPGALAQGAPVPNVNDCTFIRDPTALRDCIELYEGQRLAPGPRPAAFQSPTIDKSMVEAAGAIPAATSPSSHACSTASIAVKNAPSLINSPAR